jgi:hypothetical protein
VIARALGANLRVVQKMRCTKCSNDFQAQQHEELFQREQCCVLSFDYSEEQIYQDTHVEVRLTLWPMSGMIAILKQHNIQLPFAQPVMKAILGS